MGKSPILQIGGKSDLLSLNIVFVLNWLSMNKDIETEKAKRLKEQERRYNIR